MDFISYIEELKLQQRKNNIEQLRKEINSSWIRDKIRNYQSRFEGLFSEKEIREKIISDDLVASFFCKDPSKQNITEKACEDLLRCKKLPQSGKDTIRFDDNGNITSVALGHTKSADFYYCGYYMTQKYTMEASGAQDNQRNDVIDFLRRGSITHKVGAILDGDYWDKERNTLRALFQNNSNVWITSMSELVE